MGLADTLRGVSTEAAFLARSLGSFRHAAGNVSATMAAAASVPGVFRRDTPSDIDSVRLQQIVGAEQARPFGRAEDSARRLAFEIKISEEQARPFRRVEDSARRLAFEVEISKEQARPFTRGDDTARSFKREDLDRRLLTALGFVRS